MAESQDQEAIYQQYEKRSRFRLWMGGVMMIGVLLSVWQRESGMFVLAFLLILGGGVGAFFANVCPACHEFFGKGSSVHCPRCGVRLKRPA